jgi:hypothetical protein
MHYVVEMFKVKLISHFLEECEWLDPQIFLSIFSLHTHFQTDYLVTEPL